MCLAVIGLDAHAAFALVIAANRDEHYQRPTAPAAWWPEGWIAGRDLAAGGTWLGVDARGRWALLTNVRQTSAKNAQAPSRGALVTRVLADPRPASDVLEELLGEAGHYNGFNLLAGDTRGGAWLSNRSDAVHRLGRGTHAISNAALDTPWLKLVRTRERFDAWCASGELDPEPLFAALASREQAPDDVLPDTGISRERERLLSAPFVVTTEYGTRCSTVVLVARDGAATFEERSFDDRGRPAGVVRHRFEVKLEGASG